MKKASLILACVLALATEAQAVRNFTQKKPTVSYPSMYFSAGLGMNFGMTFNLEQESGAVAYDSGFNSWENTKLSWDDQDSGMAISFALGAEVMPQVRFEGEVLYQQSSGNKYDVDAVYNTIPLSGYVETKTDLSVFALMANGYISGKQKGIAPYIGAGIGAVSVTEDSDGEDNKASGFAYQAMIGLEHKINAKATIALEYRYFGSFVSSEDVDLGTLTGDLSSNMITAKVRFAF